MADERKVSERYRELPREEPPRALDDAILAASRRAVDARPAPLVVPSGRSRWYFPLAAAAVIVLAVAVTVHVDRERPDAEIMSGPIAVQPAERKEEATRLQEAPKPVTPAPARQAAAPVFAPDPKPEAAPAREARALRDAPPAATAGPASAPAAPAAAENAVDAARAKSRVEETQRQAAAASAAQGMRRADEAPRKAAAVLAKVAEQSPEQLLQGIADLRRQGRHDEADKALVEFRKRYPDYKISEAMLEKVERERRPAR